MPVDLERDAQDYLIWIGKRPKAEALAVAGACELLFEVIEYMADCDQAADWIEGFGRDVRVFAEAEERLVRADM